MVVKLWPIHETSTVALDFMYQGDIDASDYLTPLRLKIGDWGIKIGKRSPQGQRVLIFGPGFGDLRLLMWKTEDPLKPLCPAYTCEQLCKFIVNYVQEDRADKVIDRIRSGENA